MTKTDAPDQPHRRSEDEALLCRFARLCSLGWDWIDKRQIDCWIVSIFCLAVTWKLTELDIELVRIWIAPGNPKDGMQLAAIIGATNTPWALLQAAVVKFVFDARKGTFETREKLL